MANQYNKRARKRGEPERKFVKNFRYGVAKTQPYKGNRKNEKPFHYYNILVYLLEKYNCIISQDGLEADDELCITQVQALNEGRETIICSRDKDLRICPGWHMSWECGKQATLWPEYTDEVGRLELRSNGDVLGYGLSFFYYQMLVGDTADHIPGLKGWGKAKAYKLLKDLTTEKDLFLTVKNLYKEQLGKGSKEFFLEQANLLWMVQERGVGYVLPKYK